MPTVTIQPGDLRLSVADDEPVAEAAWRQGWTWPSTCFGQAECTVCWVSVLDGHDRVGLPPADELAALDSALAPQLAGDDVRLACRMTVTGDGVVLEKRGVRPPPPH